MEPTCLHCGAHFVGRTDKKFCDDQCRSAYHNSLNSEFTNMMRQTHRLLRRNWKILNHFTRAEKWVIHSNTLVERGFIPHMMTGVLYEKGRTIYKCYEHMYEMGESGEVYLLTGDELQSILDT